MLRRRTWDDAGVSEVVGTILVLLITVVIFSSIILWVYTIPTPTATGRASFDGKLAGTYVNGTWNGAYVNVTHLGGDDLTETETRIFLTIDDTRLTLRTKGTHFDGVSVKTYGVGGDDATWSIGETWSYLNESIPETASVSVMIVDLVRGLVLWDKALLGADGERSPIFLDKWVDADPSTSTRDPVKDGSTFAIYAKVVDPDKDLDPNSVWAYLTFGYGGVPLGWFQLLDNGDSSRGDKRANDGVFSRSLTFAAKQSWDGGLILLNATDEEGRETKTRLVMRVGEGTGTTQATGPSGLTFGTDTQRYDIFEAGDWDENGWDATSTRSFVKGQSLVVVVATKSIPSPDLKNTLTLWDPYNDRAVVYSDAPYTQPVTDDSVPSSTDAFALVDFVGGFYIYEDRWNTTSAGHGYDGVQLELGQYPLEFELKTSLTPSPDNRFHATDGIEVTDAGGSTKDYPKVRTYKDAGHTQAATTFNFTETMYVKVVVKSTDGSFDIGDVIISDHTGTRPVWASPGTSPVSVAVLNDSVSYAFSIDLSKPNLDPWNFGTSSYNLEVKNVEDEDESYSRISTQIKVRGPRWKLDVTSGQRHDPGSGSDPFQTVIFGSFFDHQENWARYDFDNFEESPGNLAPDDPITAHVLADLDGDGDLDILAGANLGDVRWYRNKDGQAHTMERFAIDTLAAAVTSVDVGHIDADGDLDAVVGTSTGDVWWYRNDGAWTANFLVNLGTAVNRVKAADVNGDGAADIIVGLDSGSDSIRVYLNDGKGFFGDVIVTTVTMDQDVGSPLHGIVTGSYTATQSSDDAYQEVRENATQLHLAANETAGPASAVQGTYVDTQADDDVYQRLTEGESGAEPKYTLGSPGHRYQFPNITASSSDVLEIHLRAFISSGSEAFQVGWSKDGSSPTWFTGHITNRQEAEVVYNLTGTAWSDETLYLHILDVDQSRRDENTDDQLTTLSVDFVYVLQTGGGDRSSLTKVWRSATLPSGKDAYKFFVEAHHTLNDEGDDFIFRLGLDAHGPHFDFLTVTKTADDDGNQSVSLPKTVGGQTLYVMVQDLDRTAGNTGNDTLFVDHLLFRTYESNPVAYPVSVGEATEDFAVADVDGDGKQDLVVAGAGSTIYVFYGDGTGKNWPASDTMTATGTVLKLDVGLISGDARHDVVVGTADDQVLLFTNGESRGSWVRSTIANLDTTEVSALRVGDVDGDYWDDVVFGTIHGHVLYLRNDQGGGWTATLLVDFTHEIHSVDIGDVDRNVIIRTHPY